MELAPDYDAYLGKGVYLAAGGNENHSSVTKKYGETFPGGLLGVFKFLDSLKALDMYELVRLDGFPL